MKTRWISLLVLIGLMLAACTPAANTPAPDVSNPSPAETDPPADATAETAQATPTEFIVPTITPLPEGQVPFKLVAGESSVTYEVGETFFNDNNRFNVAVGVTTELEGTINLDPETPSNSQIATILINVRAFESDSGRRDGVIQDRFLESNRYPIATFIATEIDGLPDTYTEGQELNFTVTGNLTVKQEMHPVTFDVTARLNGLELTGMAETTISMSQFLGAPITIAGILGTEDEVKLTFEFVARP